jgi:PPOX class probable F420-dependent enzyme
MNRRAAIAMSEAEVAAFLEAGRVLTVATIGRDGWPHLMPLWYVVRDGECWAWTYAKSQKVRNLERDARCTLQVEAGERYEELRGAMLECDVDIVRDPTALLEIGIGLAQRYYVPEGAAADPAVLRAAAVQRGAKRVGLRFRPTRIVSWDHRKLHGGH